MIGFVTVDPAARYLDQLVVAPEFWGTGVGTALIARGQSGMSPAGLDLDVNTDNARAIGFYAKAASSSPAAASMRFPAGRCTA